MQTAVYYTYGEEDAENIINGNLFYDAGRLHPLFTAVIPGRDCLEETSRRVKDSPACLLYFVNS